MFTTISKVPVSCPVCGATLQPSPAQGENVVCGHCGSELDTAMGVAKRGSTAGGRKVIELVVARFMEANGVDLAADGQALQRVIEASERVAGEIAKKGKAVIDIPFIAAGPSGPLNLKMKLDKADIG